MTVPPRTSTNARPRALILAGDGINCERETCFAAREAGFEAEQVHVNDFLGANGRGLADCRLLVVPGGFSFGDELGSGKILALKLKHGVGDALERFIGGGGAVFGICNGFQVLARLGLFGPGVVLAQNEQGHFVNRWTGLEITGRSIFTDGLARAGITRLELPIRHGEGRLVFADPAAGRGVLTDGRAVLRYETDVNGSWERIAALSANGGRVMGLMPHPEAFWTEELHPWANAARAPLGIEMFKSACRALGGRA